MPHGSPHRVHFGGAGRGCNIRRARQPSTTSASALQRLQLVHLRCASTRARHGAFRRSLPLILITCQSQSGCTAKSSNSGHMR